MKNIIKILVALFLLVSTGAASPVVSVLPQNTEVNVGDTFTVDIYVDPGNDEVYGAQFTLNFTASKIYAIAIEKKPLLTQDAVSSFVFKSCDNGANECKYAESRISVSNGISLPGTLATVTFRADAEGVAHLDLNNVKLAEPSSNIIDGVIVNDGTVTVIQPPDKPVLAIIDLEYDTINLKKNARNKLITSYIELPGHDVNDIVLSTIRMITPSGDSIRIYPGTEVGDYDEDAIPDLAVKFDMSTLVSYLSNDDKASYYAELSITGELVDGTTFEGSDTVRVINMGKNTAKGKNK